MVLVTLAIHIKIINLYPQLTPYKNKLDMGYRPKRVTKLITENIGETSSDIQLDKVFLNMMLKAQSINEKFIVLNQIIDVCSSNIPVRKQ